MKTSTAQFEMLITFMEQHGDVSKPSSNARGRISNLKNWEALAELLNGQGCGDAKSIEKWKKVWSDYKNNIKKKAARLSKAATGTGGGPAIFEKLTHLEKRVLNLIGVHVATGLAAPEPGLSQGNGILATNAMSVNLLENIEGVQLWDRPGPSSNAHSPLLPVAAISTVRPTPNLPLPTSTTFVEIGTDNCEVTMPVMPEAVMSSTPQAFVEVEVENAATPTRVLSPSPVQIARPQPALSGVNTPTRSRPRQPRRSPRDPRRRMRPTHTEQTERVFLRAEEEWRRFRMEQHRDHMNLRREELEEQREWRKIATRGLDLLSKAVNKYCQQ